MTMYIIVIFLIFAGLFILYSLSKNDFILLRKDIQLNSFFNYYFLSVLSGFLFGRIVYILNSQRNDLIHPIAFLHFIKHPGFSWYGALIGVLIMILIVPNFKKAMSRALDIFSLSFYPLIVIALMFFSNLKLLPILVGVFIVLSIILFVLFVNSYRSYSLNDGSVFFIVLILFSVGNFISEFFNSGKVLIQNYSFSQYLSIVIFVFAFICFIKNEKIYSFLKIGGRFNLFSFLSNFKKIKFIKK